MTRRVALFLIAVFLLTAAAIWFLQRPKIAPSGMELTAAQFGDLPGWRPAQARPVYGTASPMFGQMPPGA